MNQFQITDIIPSELDQVANKKKSLTIEIEFGESKRDCAGLGICRIDLYKPKLKNEKRCQISKAELSTSGLRSEKIIIAFKKSNLCSKTYNQYFSSAFFWINQTYKLKKTIRVALETNRQCIPTGCYPVIETDTQLIFIC